MADYIYLLQTRLTPSQQTALQHVREAARQKGMTVFLVGGAVRDLTSGTQIRDLDVAIQGNALKLKKDLQKEGFTLLGESEPLQAAWYSYPGGVRIEVGSTLSATWPKPGKPVYKPATILDDLRRRDFTANAMAISLNEGSYGLLMDPLNGVADIENRELRQVSNYGFIEDPVRMIRAQRLTARLGWQLEERTEQRYQTGKAEEYIVSMSPAQAGYELEEIFHEEDPLRVLRRLESEGWTKYLFPAWNASKVNEAELNKLRDLAGQLEAMNIFPNPAAAFFVPLTAKLAPKEVTALREMFARPGFLEQIDTLEPATKAFAAQFTAKEAAAPSAAWKLLYASAPEQILWLAHTSKSAPVQAKFKAFFNEWSQSRQKIPYQLMQEMRITPDIKDYAALLETLFFAIMDGKLDTPEAAKAFLEPYSPPAPPPPVNLRRRAVKREPKPSKARVKKAEAAAAAAAKAAEDSLSEGAETVQAVKTEASSAAKPAKAAPVAKKEVKAVQVPAKAAVPAKPAAPAKPATPVKAAPAKKAVPAKAAKAVAKPVAVKKAAPAKKAPAKKPAPKPVKKAAPAKKVVAKKVAPKPVKKAPAKKAPAKGKKR